MKHVSIILAIFASNSLCTFSVSADDASHAGMANMGASGHEAAYMAENAAAMIKMMAEMDVKPTGDADRDFVAMMTPHHQGAIDMAVAVLKHGKNDRIREIAQKIITDQQREIVAMKLAIGDPASPSTGDANCTIPCARSLQEGSD
ncbi:DUF305 domain-containing protein [Rhizobium leguminosarum]|nr:DUF305 domain-containing protein [Rhizobium leguminosarum]